MELKTPFADILPPLSTDEYQALQADIEANGVLSPVVVDEEGNILDGHHRYKIDPDAPTITVSGLTHAEQLAYVLRSNMARRNLSPEQKKELRKTAQAAALELAELDFTQQAIGDLLGVSRSTIENWLDATIDNVVNGCKPDSRIVIPKAADPFILEELDSGKTQKQVAADYGVTRQAIGKRAKKARLRKQAQDHADNIETQHVPVLDKLYDVIVIDPPWPMKKIEREVAPDQVGFDYPTMTKQELEIWGQDVLDPVCAHDCHLWLWTTHKFLPMGLELLGNWDFKYICTFVWHKPGGFQPFNLPQYNCEFILYAHRGNPQFIDTKQFNTCFQAPRQGHSIKPEYFYDTVRRVTEGRRLDMFNRRAIAGFDTWGNEAK